MGDSLLAFVNGFILVAAGFCLMMVIVNLYIYRKEVQSEEKTVVWAPSEYFRDWAVRFAVLLFAFILIFIAVQVMA